MSVVTDALDRLRTTAASHHRVIVVEVMGRNAGWIALASGLAGGTLTQFLRSPKSSMPRHWLSYTARIGANVILLPEIRWKWEAVMSAIKARAQNKSHRYSLVVVAEGCYPPGSDSQIHSTDVKEAVRYYS